MAQYPSKICKVAPGLPIDLVESWRRIARKHRISFGIYVSTLRNDVLVAERPEWARTRLNGTESEKIEHTSPYLDQWLKPVLAELYSSYAPDGFFFDGDYWAVGESLNSYRADAARSKWPERGHDVFATMSASEHRLLTVETYKKYLEEIGKYLTSLSPLMVSSVNLAFTFRHPTSPPHGLGLVTSDLPPFYGALESWIETAVALPEQVRRDLVVPLYAEPEGGGRKYQKSVSQLIHETAPLIANGEDIHVYFPMSRRGEIDQTYVGTLNDMRSEMERREADTRIDGLQPDFDVLCLSDTDTLQRSQDFGRLRGSFLAASAAGFNVGIASTELCRERLSRTRLLIVPSGKPESQEAERIVSAAVSSGVEVIGPQEEGFSDRMLRSNWNIEPDTISLLLLSYTNSRRDSIWSKIEISRPWTTFLRGSVSRDGSWRIFLWNGIRVGNPMGRHVLDKGAGYAGIHKVQLKEPLRLSRAWGYAEIEEKTAVGIRLNLTGAFAVLEGF